MFSNAVFFLLRVRCPHAALLTPLSSRLALAFCTIAPQVATRGISGARGDPSSGGAADSLRLVYD
eukprot:2576114-Pyramimonas_sp.AAC.1